MNISDDFRSGHSNASAIPRILSEAFSSAIAGTHILGYYLILHLYSLVIPYAIYEVLDHTILLFLECLIFL